MNATPNNLPLQLSSFIGRELEMGEIERLLATARLLTLTGAGGCGKTRLALQVTAQVLDTVADGAWFIELASLADPALIAQRVAATLDIREQPGQPLIATLNNHLRDKSLLLVLDNCEHLVEACAQLADGLLRGCPHLQILATSREALNIDGEMTYLVPSLQIPDPQDHLSPDHLAQYESVRLFVERAIAAQAHFGLTPQNAAAVAQLCQRLDGIPLAIELAAARVNALSVEQIAARLDDAFRLLVVGPRMGIPRHQTLRATMDWSHELLSGPEHILFRRLSVFAGGWTLEAAEAVCSDDSPSPADSHFPGAGKFTSVSAPRDQPMKGVEGVGRRDVLDLLTQLMSKSLVLAEEREGIERYRMLETIRQYAHEKLLESGEAERVRNSHLDYFLHLAEQAETHFYGPEQARWFEHLERVHDNLRAALEWSLQSRNGIAALRLAGALTRFWFIRGHNVEAYERLRAVLALPEAQERTAVRANALNSVAFFEWSRGNYRAMHQWSEEAGAIAEEVGDQRSMSNSLLQRGNASNSLGDYDAARIYLEKGLALNQAVGDVDEIGTFLTFLGESALFQNDYERAQMLFDKAEPLIRESGNKTFFFYLLRRLGQVARYRGDYQAAAAYYQEFVALSLAFGPHRVGLAKILLPLAGLSRELGQVAHAAKLLGAVEPFLESTHYQLETADGMDYERTLAAVRTQLDEATFGKAWAEGRAMTLEQAIAEAERITAAEQLSAAPAVTTPSVHPAGLTDREVEVLRWLARGLNNQEIADKLVLSRRTVHAHLRSIFSKLDVTTRTAAARVAIEYRLV